MTSAEPGLHSGAHLCDSAATEAAGAALASALAATLADGDTSHLVIWLEGDLGAGKTTLTRGLLRGLGHTGSVKSPTYTLLEPYVVSRIALYHFDFYRFNHPDEFLEAGLDEYFAAEGVCVVEWAEKALPHVPAPDLRIQLSISPDAGSDDADGGRNLQCHALSAKGRACLSRIRFPS